MPLEQEPGIAAPSASKLNQPEIQNVQDGPVHSAEAPTAGDEQMTDVPLQDATPGGEKASDRAFPASGEAGTSQARGLPELPKGMWSRFTGMCRKETGRVKSFFKNEVIRMVCGEQFVKPPKRKGRPRPRR